MQEKNGLKIEETNPKHSLAKREHAQCFLGDRENAE